MRQLFSWFLVSTTLLLGNTEPPMPMWTAEEHARILKDGWVAGGSLLTFEPLPDEIREDETPLAIEKPTPEELHVEPINENEVSEEFLADYFAEKPPDFLVDPQQLLGTKEKKDLETFLRYHANDSSIDMHIYVFGGDQEIPGDVREEEVVERLYSVGKPAVVVYYYLGAPQRSAMYLSPVLTDAVSIAEQRRALDSSSMQAFANIDPMEQLQAFLVQMSIRIYWMERIAEGTAAETLADIPPSKERRNFRNQDSGVAKKIQIPGWAKVVGGALIALFGAIILLVTGAAWWRSRARFVFPEFDVEPRLGGSHAAGIGAVISFSSSEIPPARQRNQVPDYMRRA